MKKHLILIIAFFLPVLNFLFSQNSCMPEGITFTSQAQIDSFPVNYPGCTEIEGDVIILEDETGGITNLEGLNNLTFIGGDLSLGLWVVLAPVGNEALTNLNGLENLKGIGGSLELLNNDSLNSLNGLINLTSIGGDLYVEFNDGLLSLNGLNNLDYTTIENIFIRENLQLSICEIRPVCNFLKYGGQADFSNNSPGCNSPQEVKKVCAESLRNATQILPNPTTGVIQICTLDNSEWEVSVMDAIGRTILGSHMLLYEELDISDFPTGLYFIRLNDGQQSITNRIVKQ